MVRLVAQVLNNSSKARNRICGFHAYEAAGGEIDFCITYVVQHQYELVGREQVIAGRVVLQVPNLLLWSLCK